MNQVSDTESQPAIANLDDSSLYINRELSQLQFNIRVLEQALDESVPLLERLKFLLIFSSNMDEFFEIRVAGLKRQVTYSRPRIDADGLQPQQALARIAEVVHEQVERQYRILNQTLLPALAAEGIHFVRRRYWTPAIRNWVEKFFHAEVAPIVTPIGLDSAHPFPLLANKSLNFIVELEGVDAFGRDSGLAILPAPRSLPRLIRLPEEVASGGVQHVFLSSIIHAHADDLFQGMRVKSCYQFRLTRNADLSMDVDDVADLATALRGELYARRFGDAVRLEVADNCPPHLVDYLLQQFNLGTDELYLVHGPVNLTRLFAITELDVYPHLRFEPFTPAIPKSLLKSDNLFQAVAQKDVLLYHPYQSFTPVIDFLRRAAQDPAVLAIKQTLYRSGVDSEIVNALVEAARNGKEVTVVIELRARFDEESNLALASRLQAAGAVVIYGMLGFKTHAKLALVLRREQDLLVRYAHLGTGNYHADNARLYTDYSLLTGNPALCEDVSSLFNQLVGMGQAKAMHLMLHAPFTLRSSLMEMIVQEESNALTGLPGHIVIKVNALTDAKMIKALYRASQAGVRVDLIIRGMCCLRPGIPGISENIHVRSVIGRQLEHSRVYYFLNAGAEERMLLSSADWMERNLDRRIEACFPLNNPKMIRRVKKELSQYLRDNTHAWLLQSDGSYVRLQPGPEEKPCHAQQQLQDKLSLPLVEA